MGLWAVTPLTAEQRDLIRTELDREQRAKRARAARLSHADRALFLEPPPDPVAAPEPDVWPEPQESPSVVEARPPKPPRRTTRVYVRKFDWDEARRLHADGWTYGRIGKRFGVSYAAVRRVCDPEFGARLDAHSREHIMSGVCCDCGRTGVSRYGRAGRPRCQDCAARARATTVGAATLLCTTCRRWKADGEFPSCRTEGARRGRHSQCRTCQTDAKRRYREKNRQPCSHGCGTLVDTVDRRDKNKPLECHACAMRRIHTRAA